MTWIAAIRVRHDRPPGFVARFTAACRGATAVEFALLAPLLVTTYFGVAGLTEGLMASRKASVAASTIGDLTAQAASASPSPSRISDIVPAGPAVAAPPAIKIKASQADTAAGYLLQTSDLHDTFYLASR